MKQSVVNLLAILVFWVLCTGCSSVKPTQKTYAAIAAPQVQEQAGITHTNIMTKFVNEWFLGKAPPPELSEKDVEGGVYYVSIIGLILAEAAQCLH